MLSLQNNCFNQILIFKCQKIYKHKVNLFYVKLHKIVKSVALNIDLDLNNVLY